MKKIVFACDLDNTLIHSHKKKREGDICVEMLDGKEQSFMTPHTIALIEEVTQNENIFLLPVTTRSIAQYLRIQWPEGCVPELALVCNGAILLRNGVPDPNWLAGSNAEIEPYRPELSRLQAYYQDHPAFKTVRIVDDMFLFLYCLDPETIEETADACRKVTSLAVEYTGSKLYIFPDPANKGRSVRRFADTFGYTHITAAGDSMIDCPMLAIADTALVPYDEMATLCRNPHCLICPADQHFSEFILTSVLQERRSML